LSHKSEIQKEENFSPSINNRGINKYQQVQINSSKIDINNESVNNNILNNNNFSGKNTYNDIEIQSENKQLNNTLSPSNINMNIPSPSFKNINHFDGTNQQIKSIIENIFRSILMKNPKVIKFHDRTIFEIDPKNIINVTNQDNDKIYKGYITSAHITENGLFMQINYKK